MSFKQFMDIILCTLGIILIFAGVDLIFNWGYHIYWIILFLIVIIFNLGVIVCKYFIIDLE